MEFPITRERLHNYKRDEAVAVETRQRVDATIKKICKEIERIVLTSEEKRYIYKIYNSDRYGGNTYMSPNTIAPPIQLMPILQDIIDSLRTVLPDSKITMDPLETYILIDWS